MKKSRRTVFIDPKLEASMRLKPGIDWSAVANEAFRFKLKLLGMQRGGAGGRGGPKAVEAVPAAPEAAVSRQERPEPSRRPAEPRRPATPKPAAVSVDEIRRRIAERRAEAGASK